MKSFRDFIKEDTKAEIIAEGIIGDILAVVIHAAENKMAKKDFNVDFKGKEEIVPFKNAVVFKKIWTLLSDEQKNKLNDLANSDTGFAKVIAAIKNIGHKDEMTSYDYNKAKTDLLAAVGA